MNRPHNLRFSLFTLLLVMAVVALSITVAMLGSELFLLRAESKRLNEERGTLVIADPSQLQAIRVPKRFAGEDRCTFRVFIPEGKLYRAIVQLNKIPKNGYPTVSRYAEPGGIMDDRIFTRLGPGEKLLTLRIVRSDSELVEVELTEGDEDAEWPTQTSFPAPPDRWPVIEPARLWDHESGVGMETTLADETGKLVLWRRRIEIPRDQTAAHFAAIDPDEPLDGLMFWVEPISNPVGKQNP